MEERGIQIDHVYFKVKGKRGYLYRAVDKYDLKQDNSNVFGKNGLINKNNIFIKEMVNGKFVVVDLRGIQRINDLHNLLYRHLLNHWFVGY
jgi:hypothetical protein